MASISKLEEIAKNIRRNVLRSLTEAGSGHLGGSLGLTDVFTVLYFHFLKHFPNEPNNPNRDKLVLSIGHVAPVLYTTLAEAGYFDKSELSTLRKLGSRLQGHPGRDHGLPGLELSAGSLGQGLSVAVGMALSDRIDHIKRNVVCVLGDGEIQEGSVWEAAMSAAHYNLNKICAIVDRNGLQIDGPTSKVMEIEPLVDKWNSFGWHVLVCDGNDIHSLIETFKQFPHTNKPMVIIAHTKMGKGVISIEDNYNWHGKVPTENELVAFLAELK